MTWLYENKVVRKTAPARRVYDAIRTASPQGRCPLCGHIPVVMFEVQPPESWSTDIADRVHRHFASFGLGPLYSMQAARLISDIRSRLDVLLREKGPAAVRDHLKQDEESRRKADLNSWQAACYGPLAASDWFCAGGFRF